MINQYKKITVRTFGPSGSYTDRTADALCTDESRRKGDGGFGGTGRAAYVLSGTGEVMPEAGDIIMDEDREREITEIRICRDLTGKIRAIKCVTFN